MTRQWIILLILSCLLGCILIQSKEEERKPKRGLRRSNYTSAHHLQEATEGENRKRFRILPQEDEESERQRIVLLAGPHKTASSSIQENMYQWTTATEDSPDVILPSWAWPVPPKVVEEQYHLNPSKGFYPLMEALSPGSGHRNLFRDYEKEKVVEFYKDEFESVWEKGYNLIIGTEAMDRLVDATVYVRDGKLRRDLLNTLPEGVLKKDITAVVVYRAPRISHVISLWHQCCAQSGMTFKEYLTDFDKSERRLHSYDSIALAKSFLEEGIYTVLIDFSGVVIDAGYDISDVIACDILKAPCTEDEQLKVGDSEDIDEEELTPTIKNVKKGLGEMGGVTEKHLEKLDELLRRFDCTHKKLMKHPKLEVLYGSELERVFSECPTRIEYWELGYPKNRHELNEQIQEIVNRDEDDEAELQLQ